MNSRSVANVVRDNVAGWVIQAILFGILYAFLPLPEGMLYLWVVFYIASCIVLMLRPDLDLARWKKGLAGSLAFWMLSFVVDLAVGHYNHPEMPFGKAILGGPFGIGFTLFVCPGFVVVNVGGLTRHLYLRKFDQ